MQESITIRYNVETRDSVLECKILDSVKPPEGYEEISITVKQDKRRMLDDYPNKAEILERLDNDSVFAEGFWQGNSVGYYVADAKYLDLIRHLACAAVTSRMMFEG